MEKNSFDYRAFLVFVGPIGVLLLYVLYFFVFTKYQDREATLTLSQLFVVSFTIICAWDFVFVYLMDRFMRK